MSIRPFLGRPKPAARGMKKKDKIPRAPSQFPVPKQTNARAGHARGWVLLTLATCVAGLPCSGALGQSRAPWNKFFIVCSPESILSLAKT
jgi:hypothetical protein